jgi:RNA polymerase sigma factor (sigma-70 family)
VEDARATRERTRAAVELLGSHAPALRRTARRFSLCADDADDALQRALEILLTKAPTVEGRRLAAWMNVVTRNEAIAVRRSRERALGQQLSAHEWTCDPLDWFASDAPGPHERAERSEQVDEAKRALSGLKRSERLAIALQAHGYSYEEIRRICGWTYTKVNRSLAEGRAKLRSAGSAGTTPRRRA